MEPTRRRKRKRKENEEEEEEVVEEEEEKGFKRKDVLTYKISYGKGNRTETWKSSKKS